MEFPMGIIKERASFDENAEFDRPKTNDEFGETRYQSGLGLFAIIAGVFLSFSGIGAILGIPLLLWGMWRGNTLNVDDRIREKGGWLGLCPVCKKPNTIPVTRQTQQYKFFCSNCNSALELYQGWFLHQCNEVINLDSTEASQSKKLNEKSHAKVVPPQKIVTTTLNVLSLQNIAQKMNSCGYKISERGAGRFRIREPLGGDKFCKSEKEFRDYAARILEQYERKQNINKASSLEKKQVDIKDFTLNELIEAILACNYKVAVKRNGKWKIREPLGGDKVCHTAEELCEYARGVLYRAEKS